MFFVIRRRAQYNKTPARSIAAAGKDQTKYLIFIFKAIT